MAIDQAASQGQVVPDELRPTKSATLYSHAGMSSPHGTHQSFMPVNGKGGEDLSGPYEAVEDWPETIEEGWRLAGVAGVYPETPDRVMVVTQFGMRAERKTNLVWGRNVFAMKESPFAHYREEEAKNEHRIITFNREGKMIDSWEWQNHLFGKLNRIFISPYDPEKHVWVTDSHKQKIYKFTHDGKKLAMAIGEVEAGSTKDDPWKAQDIAWLPNGDFYTVALGRVDRFTKDGEHVWSLCSRGSEPGQFYDLHGLILDQERHRIYVADRGNSRIQVFDEEWNFVDEWRNILAPYTLRMSLDGHVWIGDGFTQKFLKYDLDGKLVLSWGQFGIAPGCTWGIHYFDTDQEGNLYVCEDYGDRVQKWRPRTDIAPNDPRLIGQLLRY
jgi:peptidylamidoglycolate lyase